MQSLLEYVRELYPGKDYFTTEEEEVINVKSPLRYSEIPKVECKGHQQVSMDEIKNHFGELFNTRIKIINGLNLDPYSSSYLYCDYCNTTRIEGKYRYCKDCYQDMCMLCFEETSEEIALKNGAKKYADRKDALEACRKHNLIERDISTTQFYCDVCRIYIDDTRYSNVGEVGLPDCQDVCMKCKDSPEGQKMIKEHNLVESQCRYIIDDADFGSYFDWIPVLRDEEEYDTVLVNLNPDSPYYNQVCLMAVDDHGRCGFFTISESLEEVVKKLEENNETHKNSEKEGWEEYYERPIKMLMSSKNMQIHYG